MRTPLPPHPPTCPSTRSPLQFLDLATSLIEGRVDASNYEDETRALLGERTGEAPVGTADTLARSPPRAVSVGLHFVEGGCRCCMLLLLPPPR